MDMRFLGIRVVALHQARFWGNNLEKDTATEDESNLCLKITGNYRETFTNLKSRYYESGARVFHIINDR